MNNPPHRCDVSVDESGHRLGGLEVVEVVAEVDGPVLREEREEERGQEPTLADVFILISGLIVLHRHKFVAIKGGYPNLGCHIMPSKAARDTTDENKIWKPKLGIPPLVIVIVLALRNRSSEAQTRRQRRDRNRHRDHLVACGQPLGPFLPHSHL